MDELSDANDWNLNPDHISINMENFQFFWLDARLNKSNSSLNARYYRNLIIELNNAVQFFTDPIKCIDFMKTIKKEKLILIVSGSLADQILKNIHLYKPLAAVFIFCKYQDHYTDLLTKYKKIIGIYNDRDSLLESIRKTIDRLEKQMVVITIFDSTNQSSFRNLSKEQATFFWYQLLFLLLKDIPFHGNEMEKLLKACKAYYRNNEREMKNIEEFRLQYQSNEAIEWYTRNIFLYKVVNKALLDDNIDLIYLFRFFIIDLYNDLLTEKENWEETDVLKLYRGTKIPISLIKDYLNSTGKLISIKGFLSTSRDREVALIFAGQNDPSSNSSDERGILFEINADPRRAILLADITNRSFYQHEEEVLFGPNAVFHVDSVELDPTIGYIKIKMTATDEFSNFFDKYLSLQQEDLRNYTPSIYFGRILFNKMGEIERAEAYFKMLLKRLSSDDDDIPLIYCQMGDLHLSQKNYNKALDYYKNAIRTYYDQCTTDYHAIIDCLLKIGNTYLEQGKAEQALRFGERAMRMLDKISTPQPGRRAMILQMIGKAHLVQGQNLCKKGYVYPARMEIDKADKNLQEAYRIFEAMKRLEKAHFISILGDMSNLHEEKGDCVLARELLRKQLRMAQKYLSFDDPKQQIYLENLIRVYESHGFRKVAMKIAWKKLKSYKKIFGKIHPIIAKTLVAMGYYVTVCHMLFDIEPIDEHTIVECLNKLSRHKDSNIINIGLFQKWLYYLIQNYPTYERRTADALRQMANIYNDMKEFDKAYSHLYRSLKIYKHHQDHLNMRTVEDFMRHIEQGSGRLHIANIVCDDNWENGLLFLGGRFDDIPILSIPSKQESKNDLIN